MRAGACVKVGSSGRKQGRRREEGSQNRTIGLECPICHVVFRRKASRVGHNKAMFCSRKCKDEAQKTGGILKCGAGEAAYRTLAFASYPHECEWCHNALIETLEVHHIDGDRNNNGAANLIILCPICHALVTRNFVIVENRKPILLMDSANIMAHFNGIVEYRPAPVTNEITESLGVGRPTRNELEELIWSHTITEIANKYGVSGTAVSNWCKKLGISKPGIGYWLKPENRLNLQTGL